MNNVSELKGRINGISDTRKITSAMETISIAKMRGAIKKYESNLEYFNRIRLTIKDIAEHTGDISHRFLTVRKGKRAVYVVIASDKGLCGGYNHNVLNTAWEEVKKHKDHYIFTIGQMARDFFEKRNVQIDVEFMHTALAPSIGDAMRIVESIILLYEQNLMDEVYVVYTAMHNTSSVSPEIIKILPIVKDEMFDLLETEKYKDEEYFKELVFDPSPDDVLESLVPQYLTGVIYGALLQSVASEHSSRMLAMSNATKNATEVLDSLSVEYNRARQEKITGELTEIITAGNIQKDN